MSYYTHLLLVIFFTNLLAGCSYVNSPLNDPDAPAGTRRFNQTRSSLNLIDESTLPTSGTKNVDDGYFFALAISGGGSRSANFAASVMFELQQIDLLNRVDVISAVSGGTLPASLYCLSDDQEWTRPRVYKKLTHSFANDLILTYIQPWMMLAMCFSDYDRSDILAGIFSKELFSRNGNSLTFADLRTDRPRLFINATDLQLGGRFVFCNQSFNQINSDLAVFPIANAVAASACVPVALHPVTLRDFSIAKAQYRHMVDGGVIDNLGLTTVLESYETTKAAAKEKGIPAPYPKGSIIVVIDAGRHYSAELSSQSDIGPARNIWFGTRLATGKLVQRIGSATLSDLIVQHTQAQTTAQDIRNLLKQLEADGHAQVRDHDGRPITIIHVGLTRAAGLKGAPHPNFAHALDDIGTYFNIPDEHAKNLEIAAKLIVNERFGAQFEMIRKELGTVKK